MLVSVISVGHLVSPVMLDVDFLLKHHVVLDFQQLVVWGDAGMFLQMKDHLLTLFHDQQSRSDDQVE